jgi:hypothetical protein
VLSLVAGWHAGVLVPVSGQRWRAWRAGGVAGAPWTGGGPSTRAARGRAATGRTVCIQTRAWLWTSGPVRHRTQENPAHKEPGGIYANYNAVQVAAGVIAGFAGHFVIVVSVGEQQLRKRQALKEAEQTREAAGRAAVQVTRASGLSLFSRLLLQSRLRVRGNAVKWQMAHVRRVEEYVKEQNDPWPSGRSSGRTQSRRARRLRERHARENVRKLEGPQVSRLVRRTKKLNKAIDKTHGAVEAAKRNSGR